jgi:hypothetical protein
MKMRLVPVLASAALLLAGCGAEPATSSGRILAYGYLPGTDLAYDLEQVMMMDMSASGEGAAQLGAADTSMAMSMEQRLVYAFAEGPQPDMVAITITYEIVGGSATLTTMGQTQFVPFEEVSSQADMPPVEMIVDASGDVVELSVGGNSVPAELLAAFEGLNSTDILQQPHIGPVFPEEPVDIGDEWEIDLSQSALGFDVSQEAEYRVVASEVVDGRPTLRIEGQIVTDTIEMTLADMMESLAETDPDTFGMEGFDPEMFDAFGIDMTYRLDRSVMDMTTWFDAEAGVVVMAEIEMPVTMSVTMEGVPGMEGEASMDIVMDVAQTLRLAG